MGILVGNVRKDDIRHLVNVDSDLYIAEDFEQLISDSFIRDITLCEEYSAYVECRDASTHCQRYARYASYCSHPSYSNRYKWFWDPEGRYGCQKLCGKC